MVAITHLQGLLRHIKVAQVVERANELSRLLAGYRVPRCASHRGEPRGCHQLDDGWDDALIRHTRRLLELRSRGVVLPRGSDVNHSQVLGLVLRRGQATARHK